MSASTLHANQDGVILPSHLNSRAFLVGSHFDRQKKPAISIFRIIHFWQFKSMFKLQMRVSYRDVTVGNHIYYARYLDLLEIARNEAFRQTDHSLLKLQEQGVIFPVVECSLHYHGAARYDDLLEIETTLIELRNVQFTMKYRVMRGTETLVTATTRHAATNLDGKPIRIPSELLSALETHVNP